MTEHRIDPTAEPTPQTLEDLARASGIEVKDSEELGGVRETALALLSEKVNAWGAPRRAIEAMGEGLSHEVMIPSNFFDVVHHEKATGLEFVIYWEGEGSALVLADAYNASIPELFRDIDGVYDLSDCGLGNVAPFFPGEVGQVMGRAVEDVRVAGLVLLLERRPALVFEWLGFSIADLWEQSNY